MSRPFPSRTFQPREPLHRRNGKIRAREIRVIDENKQQLGVMPLKDALRLAQSKGLDLIEFAPTANPPVCRITDYGKFLYEESKRTKESHKSQSAMKMKEIQISASIDPHDLGVKVNHAIEFLCEEHKVRVKLRFRGRQKAHKELGFQLMNQFIADVSGYGQADSPPKMLGDRDMNLVLSPLPRNKRAKARPQTATAEPATPASEEMSSTEADEPVPA